MSPLPIPRPTLERLGRFLRFAGVSGCGWLLDLSVLAALVRLAGASPGPANMVSSLCGAGLVFLVTRGRVFKDAQGSTPARLAAYLGYTLVQVAIASAAIAALAPPLAGEARALGIGEAALAAAVGAKTIVTPAQLMLNFLVAGRLNRARLLAPKTVPEPAHA